MNEMSKEYIFLSTKKWRLALGFIVAPYVSAFFFFTFIRLDELIGKQFSWQESLWFIAQSFTGAVFFWLFGGLWMSLFLGAPLYNLLIGRVQPGIGNAILGGIMIVTVPWFLLKIWLLLNFDYELAGINTGFVKEIAISTFFSAFIGAVGGFSFWLCAIWRA